MPAVTLACHAMATRFELVLHGDNPVALRAAGEEAFAEIDRLENQLSLYRPGSEIAQVNARASREPVRVTPEVFALLRHCERLHAETDGAFDITIAPLVRCWGFMGGTGRMPAAEEIAAARSKVGMQHVQLDTITRTVRFSREGMMLDLGAIGKGYAVSQAADLLRAAGVTSGLVHGGTSTVYGIGNPPGEDSWQVAIENPPVTMNALEFPTMPAVQLCDEAMSVSAMWGRSFQSSGKTYGHVIDPRTGYPVDGVWLSVVVSTSATETDALSTALLTLGDKGRDRLSTLRPNLRTFLAPVNPANPAVSRDHSGT